MKTKTIKQSTFNMTIEHLDLLRTMFEQSLKNKRILTNPKAYKQTNQMIDRIITNKMELLGE